MPETLHALIAARLDGLPPEERRLLQDAAVLGKTFTPSALAALAGYRGRARAAARRRSCARRCSASRPTRARPSTASTASSRTSFATSPTRRSRSASAGRDTSPRPRTSRRPSPDEDEIVEVIASHYLDAYEAVRTPRTRRRSGSARRRCSSAPATGPRPSPRPPRRGATSSRLRSSTDEPLQRGSSSSRRPDGWAGPGIPRGGRRSTRRRSRSTRPRATPMPPRGPSAGSGRSSPPGARRGVARLERAFAVISEDEPDEDLALLAACLARLLVQRRSRARRRAGGARARHRRGTCVSGAHDARAYARRGRSPPAAATTRRRARSRGTRSGSLSSTISSRRRDLVLHPLRRCFHRDGTPGPSAISNDALTMTRRVGNRPQEWAVLAEQTHPLTMLGRWEEAMEVIENFGEDRVGSGGLF